MKGNKTKVLLVEDEKTLAMIIKDTLEIEGFDIKCAENGSEGLKSYHSFAPDVMIADVMMPEMDGFETLRLVREISTVPVILLTVKSDEEDKTRGLDLGADDYVTKPFSPRELSSRVGAVLRRASWPTTMEPMAGSGVPKVGEPERSDMEERKLPKMTGAPDRSSCVSAQPAMVSASDWAMAPALVTGPMAPPRMKGTTTAHWLARA